MSPLLLVHQAPERRCASAGGCPGQINVLRHHLEGWDHWVCEWECSHITRHNVGLWVFPALASGMWGMWEEQGVVDLSGHWRRQLGVKRLEIQLGHGVLF